MQRQQFGDLFLAIGEKETLATLATQLDMPSSAVFIEFACLPDKPAEDALLAAAVPACRLVLASPENVLSEGPDGKGMVGDLLSRTVILLPDMLARFLDDQALAELLILNAPRLTLIAGPDAEQLPLARRCYRMLKDRHREDTQFKLNYHDLRKTRKAT